MGSQAPRINIGRWHRPRVYGTIVVLYLFVMSGIAIGYIILFYSSVSVWPCPNSSIGRVSCSETIAGALSIGIASSAIAGFSIAGAIMLITESKNEWASIIQYGTLVTWSGLSFLSLLGGLFVGSYLSLFLTLPMFSSNIIMYFFLYKRHSMRSA